MNKILPFLILLLASNSYCHISNKSLFIKDSLQIVKKTIKTYKKGVVENEDIVVFTYENNLISKIKITRNDGTVPENTNIRYENGILKQIDNIYAPIKVQDRVIRGESTSSAIYNYNNGLITNLDGVENKNLHHTDYFTYNESGQLIKKQIITDGTLNGEINYTYNKTGNILKKQGYDSSTTSIYNKYDDKKNPFALVFPDSYLKIYCLSKNNIKSSTRNDKEYTYEYEYNTDSYPTKIIEKVGREIQNVTLIEYIKVNIDK